MLVEAIVENGQFKLLKPVQFAHDHVHVMVDIPDGEILGFEIKDIGKCVQSSASLIQQLWSARTQTPSDEIDLLEGIEHKYE